MFMLFFYYAGVNMSKSFSSAFSRAFDVTVVITATIEATEVLYNRVVLEADVEGGTEPYTVYWSRFLKPVYVPRLSRSIGTGNPFTDNAVVSNTKYHYQCLVVDVYGDRTTSNVLAVTTDEIVSPTNPIDTTNGPRVGPTGIRFNGATGKFTRF